MSGLVFYRTFGTFCDSSLVQQSFGLHWFFEDIARLIAESCLTSPLLSKRELYRAANRQPTGSAILADSFSHEFQQIAPQTEFLAALQTFPKKSEEIETHCRFLAALKDLAENFISNAPTVVLLENLASGLRHFIAFRIGVNPSSNLPRLGDEAAAPAHHNLLKNLE
jgi:hypothetical protein